MVTKRGIAVMPGIVVRRAFVLDVGGYDIQRRMVSDEEAPREIERLNKAIAEARRELEELQNRLSKRLAEAQIGAILSTHL
ncbi:MAG: phosphoenolpyruvate--protein phosphotransferase, partial [Planctomycetes bacterium]|nr:phosphoenolpyruvate--protein phosphotransferase [Planctomycetota bacterium]